MSWRASVTVAAALLAIACGGAPERAPEGGLVLWESGMPSPRFPVPAEASWEPDYQSLYHALEPGPLVVCYGAGPMEDVIGFYAEEYGVAPDAFEMRQEPAREWFATIRRVSARLGREIQAPAGGSGAARHAVLEQRDDLPRLELHSPYPRADSGLRVAGTLVVMRWRAPGPSEAPAPGGVP